MLQISCKRDLADRFTSVKKGTTVCAGAGDVYMFNRDKVYVDVMVKFNKDGIVSPMRFVWEDGAIYDIDRVLEVKRAASVRAGGAGIMFTCLIDGRVSHLFYEENNKWFVERK